MHSQEKGHVYSYFKQKWVLSLTVLSRATNDIINLKHVIDVT